MPSTSSGPEHAEGSSSKSAPTYEKLIFLRPWEWLLATILRSINKKGD